jgi:hypothetical protein
MPIEQQSRLERLGGMLGGAMSQAAPMLGGLGAGLAGNLPQYQVAQQQMAESQQLMQQREQAQRALQQQAEAERQKAHQMMMAQTAKAALQLAEQGDFKSLVSMGMDQLRMAQANGMPLEDLQRLQLLARAASNGSEEAADNLKAELSTEVKIAKSLGLIKDPEQEEYTLSAGQTRFRGDQPIASMPNQVSPEEFTLSPGQTRYRDGVPIASMPASSGRDTLTQQKIDIARRELIAGGMPEAEASSMAEQIGTGLIRRVITDQGFARYINDITGEVKEIPLGTAGQSGPQTTAPESALMTDQQQNVLGEQSSLYGMSDEVSGIVPSLKALGAKASSMFGIEAFPETVTARQIARGSMQGLIKALQNNPRYAVSEMETIRNDIANLSPRLASGGPELRSQMQGIHALLSRNYQNALRDSANPNNDAEMRQGARQSARDIKDFLSLMGYVDASTLRSPEAVYETPISSIEMYIRSASPAELDGLPEDVQQAIEARIQDARRGR